MTINYPQRWLREHNAIPTDKGWKRATTHELLKCQKGLELENVEEFKDQVYTANFIETPQFLFSEDNYLLQELPSFTEFYGTDFYTRNQYTFEVSTDKKTITLDIPEKSEFIYAAIFIQLDISTEQYNNIDDTYDVVGTYQGLEFNSTGEDLLNGFLFHYQNKYYTVFITNENTNLTLKLTIDGNVNAIENTFLINGFNAK